MPERAFGRLVAPDERDRLYAMSARIVRPQIVPDWRFWTPGETLNQGPHPHCVGYAWRGWQTCSPTRRATPAGDAVAIYNRAQQLDEWPGEGYDGTSVRAGAKVMAEQGRLGEYVWADSEQALRLWLLTRGPVVMGTSWYEGMSDAHIDRDQIARPTGALQGGHAYLCIGYSRVRRMYRCVNSWGATWGFKGRFWITEADMATLLSRDGEACGAVEIDPP